MSRSSQDDDYDQTDHEDSSHPSYGTGWSKEEYENIVESDD